MRDALGPRESREWKLFDIVNLLFRYPLNDPSLSERDDGWLIAGVMEIFAETAFIPARELLLESLDEPFAGAFKIERRLQYVDMPRDPDGIVVHELDPRKVHILDA